MYIDTHCHISENEGVHPDEYMIHAKEKQVSYVIASFCEKETYQEITSYLEKYDNLFVSVGFHPEEANKIIEEDLENLENLIQSSNNVVAIGEIGLDYYWHKDNKEIQREIFNRQLKLAEKYDLPVVIHSRDSIGEVYDILKDYSLRGVIHCFSGSKEMAENFVKLGYMIGIGGVVTFKNSKLYQVVESLPLDTILLETDSPYLSPEPFRGKVNESSNIPLIAEKIAEIKNISLEKVEEITTNNAIRMFDLPI